MLEVISFHRADEDVRYTNGLDLAHVAEEQPELLKRAGPVMPALLETMVIGPKYAVDRLFTKSGADGGPWSGVLFDNTGDDNRVQGLVEVTPNRRVEAISYRGKVPAVVPQDNVFIEAWAKTIEGFDLLVRTGIEAASRLFEGKRIFMIEPISVREGRDNRGQIARDVIGVHGGTMTARERTIRNQLPHEVHTGYVRVHNGSRISRIVVGKGSSAVMYSDFAASLALKQKKT